MNPLLTDAFPSQMVSNVESVSIWWRHHVMGYTWQLFEVFFCPIVLLTLKQLGNFILSNVIAYSNTTHYKYIFYMALIQDNKYLVSTVSTDGLVV